MAIKNLDYKLQGPKLKDAVADVLTRPNEMNGRYKKGGGFGLNFYSDDYEIENYRWITERADVADEMIRQAESEGRNVDDPLVLKEIARDVIKNIKLGKSRGSFIKYIIYLFIPIIIVGIFYFFTQ